MLRRNFNSAIVAKATREILLAQKRVGGRPKAASLRKRQERQQLDSGPYTRSVKRTETLPRLRDLPNEERSKTSRGCAKGGKSNPNKRDKGTLPEDGRPNKTMTLQRRGPNVRG